MHMPQHQTVIDALCQVINRQLPLPLQRLLDELMERLQQQRIHAGSNKEEQTYIDFLRVCKRLRNVVQLNAATSICQRLCHSVPLTTPPSDLSEWNLVDDIEVEAMLDIRRIARALRVPLGNLEWRVCNCLEQIDSGLKKDSDNPLSLEFLLHNVQAELRLHEQPGAIREVFYHCCVDVLGRDLKGYLEQLDGVFARFAIVPRRAALSVTNTAPPHVHASTALNNSYQAIKQLTPLRGEARVANSAAQAVTLTQLQQALPHLQALPCPEHGWTAESFLGAMQAAGLQPSPQQCQDAQLVAELFQHIEHEEVIAPGVKPALRRLMAPVAQAVMLEPAAFADPLHPVRASLDKMMRLCDFAEPANLVLDRRMEQLIDQIVSEYQGDSRVFSRYDEQLEQLLAAQQRAYNNNAERVLQYHRGRDKLQQARRQVESLLPGQYQHIPVLQHLQLQLQGLEPIELIATPFSTEPDTVASLAPEQQRWHERLQQLSTGDWLSTESGQALQLIWANPANDHFVLADRQGHEAGSFNSLELMQRLASGWIGISTTTPPNVVRDHLQSVVGQLYRDIAHARSHDELTGVYNRRSFEACVAQTINQYESYAFIYGHIDQFSLLNSSCVGADGKMTHPAD